MTIEEAEATLKSAGADAVTFVTRDGDRSTLRVESGGRKIGISVELPYGLDKAVPRLKQWLREGL